MNFSSCEMIECISAKYDITWQKLCCAKCMHELVTKIALSSTSDFCMKLWLKLSIHFHPYPNASKQVSSLELYNICHPKAGWEDEFPFSHWVGIGIRLQAPGFAQLARRFPDLMVSRSWIFVWNPNEFHWKDGTECHWKWFRNPRWCLEDFLPFFLLSEWFFCRLNSMSIAKGKDSGEEGLLDALQSQEFCAPFLCQNNIFKFWKVFIFLKICQWEDSNLTKANATLIFQGTLIVKHQTHKHILCPDYFWCSFNFVHSQLHQKELPFGILALQNLIIHPDSHINIMNVCKCWPVKPLGDFLVGYAPISASYFFDFGTRWSWWRMEHWCGAGIGSLKSWSRLEFPVENP